MSIMRDIAANTMPRESFGINTVAPLTPLCPLNVQRYSLTLCLTTAGSVIVTMNNDPGTFSGILLLSGNPVTLTVKEHGSIAQAAWSMRFTGAADVVSFLECLFPRE